MIERCWPRGGVHGEAIQPAELSLGAWKICQIQSECAFKQVEKALVTSEAVYETLDIDNKF